MFTEEVGTRLASRGHQVTLFTSAFHGCEPQTNSSGMMTIRRGGKYRVYGEGRRFVKDHLSDFDMIIDEINTVPFGAPKVAGRIPVVALIHQLAREIWFYETRFPLSALGYFALEPMWLRQYRHTFTITVSDSTKSDLLRRGFERVEIVHNGIGVAPLEVPASKEPFPVLIFVGRLVSSKRPHHAMSAFREVKSAFPNAQMWIIGDGYMRKGLEKRANQGVTFFGRVSDLEKFRLLSRAHLLLAPSVREGWGTSIIEANAMGTPAVGYDIQGLKDSIVHGVTGFRVQSNPHSLARAAMSFFQDSTLSRQLSINALEWSRKFNWNDAVNKFDALLQSSVNEFGWS